MNKEIENKVVQLKKEIEILEDIAVSEGAFVKAKQEQEMVQTYYEKVWCQSGL
jgi:hypothetical protein